MRLRDVASSMSAQLTECRTIGLDIDGDDPYRDAELGIAGRRGRAEVRKQRVREVLNAE